jgi:AcrR family transcriptional regulator
VTADHPDLKPGRRRNPRLRTEVVAAVLQLLEEVGFGQLTMTSVAQRAGISKSTLYRRWPSKTHLVLEAIATDLGPPLQSVGDTAVDVRALVEWTVNTFVPQLCAVGDLSHDRTGAAELENLISAYHAANAALLLDASGRGDLPHDLDLTTTLDLITGAAMMRKLTNRRLDTTLIDQLTTLLLGEELPRTSPSIGAL